MSARGTNEEAGAVVSTSLGNRNERKEEHLNAKQQQENDSCSSENNAIIIKGLSNNTSANDLKIFLKQFGKVGRIQVLASSKDKDAIECQRFAHVIVPTMEGLLHIMETINGKELQGARLQVTKESADSFLPTRIVNCNVTQSSKQSEVESLGKPTDNCRKSFHIMNSDSGKTSKKDDNLDENRGLLYSDQSSGNSPSASPSNTSNKLDSQSVSDTDTEADYVVSSSNQKCERKTIHQRGRSIGLKNSDRNRQSRFEDDHDKCRSLRKRNVGSMGSRSRDISSEKRFRGGFTSPKSVRGGRGRNENRNNNSDRNSSSGRKPSALFSTERIRRSRSPNPDKRGNILSYEQIKEAQHERAQKRRAERRERDQSYEQESEREFTDDEGYKRREYDTVRELKRLEREREKLQQEREQIEKEKLEILQFERERQRWEREKIEKEREEVRRAKLKMVELQQAEARRYNDNKSRQCTSFPSAKQNLFGNTIAEVVIEKERQERRMRDKSAGVDVDAEETRKRGKSPIKNSYGTDANYIPQRWASGKDATYPNITRYIVNEQQQHSRPEHLKQEDVMSRGVNFKRCASSTETSPPVVRKYPRHHPRPAPSNHSAPSRAFKMKRRDEIVEMLDKTETSEQPVFARLSHHGREQWVRGGGGFGNSSQTVSLVQQASSSSQDSVYNVDMPFHEAPTTSGGGGVRVCAGGLKAAIANLYETKSSGGGDQFPNLHSTNFHRYYHRF